MVSEIRLVMLVRWLPAMQGPEDRLASAGMIGRHPSTQIASGSLLLLLRSVQTATRSLEWLSLETANATTCPDATGLSDVSGPPIAGLLPNLV